MGLILILILILILVLMPLSIAIFLITGEMWALALGLTLGAIWFVDFCRRKYPS